MIPTADCRFPVTRWTLFCRAREGTELSARRALGEFCDLYWFPLYAYARRSGNTPEDAKDMTQGFFEQLLAKDYLSDVAEEKGKLRSFLLVAMKHYMAKQWRRNRAQRRHPGQPALSFDQEVAEERLHCASSELSPDRFFDLHWTIMLLKSVTEQLRQEYVAKGQGDLFEALQGFLSRRDPEQPYAAVASQFDMTENSVAVTAYRMRRRFLELLRHECAETVGEREDVEDELNYLLGVLS